MLKVFQDITVEGTMVYCSKCKLHEHDIALCRKLSKKKNQGPHVVMQDSILVSKNPKAEKAQPLKDNAEGELTEVKRKK